MSLTKELNLICCDLRTYTASVSGADPRQSPVAGFAAVALEAPNAGPAHALPALVASI